MSSEGQEHTENDTATVLWRLAQEVDDRCAVPWFRRVLQRLAADWGNLDGRFSSRRLDWERARAASPGKATGIAPVDFKEPTVQGMVRLSVEDRAVLAATHLVYLRDGYIHEGEPLVRDGIHPRIAINLLLAPSVYEYMLKTVSESARRANSGFVSDLTGNMRRVWDQIGPEPRSAAEIARALSIDEPQVKNCVSMIRRKRGRESIRTQPGRGGGYSKW